MVITTTFLRLLIVAVMLGNFGCSGGSPINSTNASNSLPMTPRNSNGSNHSQDQPDAVRSALKREGSKLNLQDLKEMKLSPSQSEVRLWVGLGLLVPRCFIVKNRIDLWQASYLTIQDSSPITTSLASPRSGWPAFEQLLRDHKVIAPLGLKPDDQYAADPDEEIIAIELKAGDRYDFVYYSARTSSDDGRSVIELCKVIEKEFAIKMGCEPN